MTGPRALSRIVVLAPWLVLGLGANAQGPAPDGLRSARDEVQEELVRALPPNLLPGPVAILPPAVEDREAVDERIAADWAVGLSELLHRLMPGVPQTDRMHLAEILREQRFGESPYADREGAAKVGKLAAARSLVVTRLREFRLRGGRIRVVVDLSVVDVETGRNLWTRSSHRGIYPAWVKALLAAGFLAAVLAAARLWWRGRRTKLVGQRIPEVKEDVRIDVDGLARSAREARERLWSAGLEAPAVALQRSLVDLDAVLDLLRHALPGGDAARTAARDLSAAVKVAERLGSLVNGVRKECDTMEVSAAAGEAMALRLGKAAGEIRALVDEYRSHLG